MKKKVTESLLVFAFGCLLFLSDDAKQHLSNRVDDIRYEIELSQIEYEPTGTTTAGVITQLSPTLSFADIVMSTFMNVGNIQPIGSKVVNTTTFLLDDPGNLNSYICVVPFGATVTIYDETTSILDISYQKVSYLDFYGYVPASCLVDDIGTKEIEIPDYSGFKSFMPASAITNTRTLQYQIKEFSAPDDFGLMKFDGRYLIAVGQYLDCPVGTYLDLILDNGVIVPCIVGDAKANCDTDEENLFTVANGCMSEFIVDEDLLPENVRFSGNISSLTELFNSPVAVVKVYDKNVRDNY